MTSKHAYLKVVVLMVSALVVVAAACLGLLLLSKDNLSASQNLQVGQGEGSGHPQQETVRGFLLQPGALAAKDGVTGESLRKELDAAMADAVKQGYDTVLLETLYEGQLAFDNGVLPSQSSVFDPMAAALKAAKDYNLKTYAIYHVLYGEEGSKVAPLAVVTPETVNEIASSVSAFVRNYPDLNAVVFSDYTGLSAAANYGAYQEYGDGIDISTYLADIQEAVISGSLNAAKSVGNESLRSGVVAQSTSAIHKVLKNDQTDFVLLRSDSADTIYDLDSAKAWLASNAQNLKVPVYALYTNEVTQEQLEADQAALSSLAHYSGFICSINLQNENIESSASSSSVSSESQQSQQSQSSESSVASRPSSSSESSIPVAQETPDDLDSTLDEMINKVPDAEELSPTYKEEDLYAKSFEIISPLKDTFSTGSDTQLFMGGVPKGSTLTINGKEIECDQYGSFSYTYPLEPGLNTIVVATENYEKIFYITRNVLIVKNYSPTGDLILNEGMPIGLNVTARIGSVVTASFNGQTVKLSVTETGTEFADYYATVYAPAATEEMQDLGEILFTVSYQGKQYTYTGASCQVNPIEEKPENPDESSDSTSNSESESESSSESSSESESESSSESSSESESESSSESSSESGSESSSESSSESESESSSESSSESESESSSESSSESQEESSSEVQKPTRPMQMAQIDAAVDAKSGIKPATAMTYPQNPEDPDYPGIVNNNAYAYANWNYSPLPNGTLDFIIGNPVSYNGVKYYLLRSGVRIKAADAKVVTFDYAKNDIHSLTMRNDGQYTYIELDTDWQVPYTLTYSSSGIKIHFCETESVPNDLTLTKTPLFQSATWSGTTLNLRFRLTDGFLGYQVYYNNEGNLVFQFTNPPQSGSIVGARISIDPGHSMAGDPGALGANKNINEAQLDYYIGAYLYDQLKELGAVPYLIPSNTENLYVPERLQYTRNHNAQVQVSIHHNAFNGSACGVDTYYFQYYSKSLARCIQKSVFAAHSATGMYSGFIPHNSIQQGRYLFTLDTGWASVMIENGFIDHQATYTQLVKPEFQYQVAMGITKGLKEYFDQFASLAGYPTGTQTTLTQ